MTPEEKKVVQLAIQMHRIGHVPDRREENIFRTAVHELIFRCDECNSGGHTCPGDGNSIAHGEADCGEHGPCNHDGCSLDVQGNYCARGHVQNDPPSAPDVPEWVETTWLHVRTGDHVRLNGQEADVKKHTKNNFHAKVDTWNDRVTGRPRDNVTGRWDHVEVAVELAHLPGKPLPFPPNSSVEVLMDAERKAIHLLAVEMGGEVVS